MQIVNAIEKIQDLKGVSSPVILTIGNFEGVHLGHQALLKHVVNIAANENKTPTVLTFANHPSEVLKQKETPCHLTTASHKLKLFEDLGIRLTITLLFTKEFAEQSAEEFLLSVNRILAFKALILGSDAHLGRNREGNPGIVAAIAKKIGFTLDYFPDFNFRQKRISSSQIRELVQVGDLNTASLMLGRLYSICGKVIQGLSRGASLGFPTANINVDKLCLPPTGVYAALVHIEGEPSHVSRPGVANLGNAPTIQKERGIVLEVHLFDKSIDLYEKTLEVKLLTFIRPEMRFDSIEALKAQIAEDVVAAKNAIMQEYLTNFD